MYFQHHIPQHTHKIENKVQYVVRKYMSSHLETSRKQSRNECMLILNYPYLVWKTSHVRLNFGMGCRYTIHKNENLGM